MEPFKLMDTPFLVFQKIIKLMEIIEVFEISQTSKRMFASIKYSRRRIQPIMLHIGEKYRAISVFEKKDVDSKFIVHLKTEKVEEDVMRQLRVKDTVLDIR
ncbi:hypothetical protein CRE_10396 [Caenorhabditis remanei]|uniref:F-box domain-containing protein n=1 Tax=Caenorhabditis remanei TaxID=31234 RepID=E3MQJ2_CAERE|nr:hypothetical protein CRE_10396 [Caenorhabditis remanei]